MHNNEKCRKLKKYLQLINRFLPFAFWVSVILGFGEIRFASITILSALLQRMRDGESRMGAVSGLPPGAACLKLQ